MILNKTQFQRIARYVIPTVLAVIISYFLLREIDLREIPETISRLSFHAIVVGFVSYCLLVIAKTLRFRTLLGLKSSVSQIFPILAMHTFWGNILPMRTGDISYVYLMQKRQKVDATQGIASLMMASLIDLMLLIALMIFTASLLLPKLSGQFTWTVLFLLPLLIGTVLLIVMIMACVAPNFCTSVAMKCANPLLRLDKSAITWIVRKLLDILNQITAFRLNLQFLKVWGYSFLCLTIRFGFQCYLVSEMGVGIPIIEVLFALAFTNGINLLPIQTVGNFGTTEFPFATFLNYFGTSMAVATVTGFSLHILILLYCLPLGVYGYLAKSKEKKHENN